MNQKQKILILGADGFLGSNLAESLLKDKKFQIRAFDLFANGVSRNLSHLQGRIEIFPGNFLNKHDLRRAVRDMDYVFHFVSLTTPGSSMDDPLIDIDTNVRGTIRLLDECVKAKIKKIIFPSSGGAIYGNQETDFLSEEDPLNPISPYAISKLTIEKYLEYYRIHKGLDYLVIRLSNPYGPKQNIVGSQGIIPIFLNQVKMGRLMTIFGDGENVRDYIYIDDAIENVKKISFIKTRYRVYNIGSGKGASINRVVKIIEKVTAKKVKIKKMPARDSDVRRVFLSTKRIRKEIDFTLNTNLKEGIRKTWEWVKKI